MQADVRDDRKKKNQWPQQKQQYLRPDWAKITAETDR
jgi:hypothetical protein